MENAKKINMINPFNTSCYVGFSPPFRYPNMSVSCHLAQPATREVLKWQQFYNASMWYLRVKRWVLQRGVRVKRIYMSYLSK